MRFIGAQYNSSSGSKKPLRGIASLQAFAQRGVVGSTEFRVLPKQLQRALPCRLDQPGVFQNVAYFEGRQPMLHHAEYLTGTAEREILFTDPEAVLCFGHN